MLVEENEMDLKIHEQKNKIATVILKMLVQEWLQEFARCCNRFYSSFHDSACHKVAQTAAYLEELF